MNKKENQDSSKTASSASSAAKGGLATKHIVLILGALVIVTVGVVAAIVLTRQPTEATPMTVGNMPIINADNLDDVMNAIHDSVEAGMFETHMNTTWTFKDGKSASSDAVMGNSKNNNFPFWFEVIVNNEVVYKSDLLPVGSQIKEIILDKDLDAGTYPAQVTINMVDNDGKPVDGNMALNITITVLE